MKKLLLLAGILAISGITFSAGLSDTRDLEVKAQIIKPLNITTKKVDFGIVASGQKNISTWDTAGDGEIVVTGKAGRNVVLSVEGLSITGGVDSTLQLVNDETGDTLLAGLTGRSSSDPGDFSGLNKFFNKSYSLDGNGSMKFIVSGIIYDIPVNISSGIYNATVKVKATYELDTNL